MEFAIQRPLYAKCISAVGGLISNSHAAAKYMGIEIKDGHLSVYVNRDEIVGKVTIDQKAVGDANLFEIQAEGSALVDGQSNIQAIVKDTSSDRITVKITKKKDEKDGAVEYCYPSGEKIGLQLVEANSEVVIDPKHTHGLFLGKELDRFGRFVSIYAGKPTMHPAHANLLFKAETGKVTFAGTDGKQFAIAIFVPEKTISEDFSVIVPHNLFTSICKLLNPEEEVSVCVTETHLILSQDLVYAATKVGRVAFKVILSREKFPNYEKVFNALSFKTTCKVNTAMLGRACERLSIIKTKTCKMSVNKDTKSLIFSKKEATGFADNIKAPLSEVNGDNIDVDIYNEEFQATAAQAVSDEIEIRLSSSTTIGLVILDNCRSVYFTPFQG